MASDVWEPVSKDRASAVTLVEELRSKLLREGKQREAKRLESPQEVLGGALDAGGAILRDQRGEAIAMIVTQPLLGRARAVDFLTLKESQQTPSGFKGFLGSLLMQDKDSSPILSIWDYFNLLESPHAASLLGEEGFHGFHRYDMVHPTGKAPPQTSQTAQSPGRLRNVGPDDIEELSQLRTLCFVGDADSTFGIETSDPLESSRTVMKFYFGGDAGRFMGNASFGLEVDGMLVGFTIVTRDSEYTYLTDVAVHPKYQGKGLASRLIRASMDALLADSGPPLLLNVTRENNRAFRLYSHLGFRIEFGPRTLWLKTKELGILPPDPVESLA
jgi:ribosomal protein S18 acetylase RimI-like enzyme